MEKADSHSIKQLSGLAGCLYFWKCLFYPQEIPTTKMQLWAVVPKEKTQCPGAEKFLHTPKIQVCMAQAEGWDKIQVAGKPGTCSNAACKCCPTPWKVRNPSLLLLQYS